MQQTDWVEMKVCLVAHGPLLLGGGLPIGNVRISEPFVAGSVWRGAVARAMLERLGKRTYSGRPIADPQLPAAFTTVFSGQTPAQFGFLYPLVGEREQPEDWVTAPIPLTASTCKRHPGFQEQAGHGVFDGLLHRIHGTTTPTTAGSSLHACPVCGERLERMRGLASAPPATAQYQEEKLGTRSLVRVGMNRYTETAQDQMLYVQDVLEPGHEQDGLPKSLRFVGHWRGSAQQAELFHALLKEHLLPAENGGFYLRIGTARARGLGAVQIHLTPPQPYVAAARCVGIEERLAHFQPGRTKGEVGRAELLYAALTLRSPMQLLDGQGISTTQLTEQLVRDYQPTAPPNLKILPTCSVLEQEISRGWSAAWGLPKPVTSALAAGSVLVLCAPVAERLALLDFLTAVEQQGLGERRAEGWGELLVCDRFHIDYDEHKLNDKKGQASDNHQQTIQE